MKKIAVILFLFISVAATTASAQCAMCKRTAETDMQSKRNEKSARGLNNGILYLLSVPYLIGGVGAVVWWVNKKKNQQ